MSTIVVGYDASPGARAALDRALDVARAFGDRLIIGFGVSPPGSMGDEYRAHRDALRDQAEAMIAEALERAVGAGVDVETALVEDRPSAALVQLADDNDARMIVVGSWKERPLKGAILGSTPHRLLYLAGRPVMVVPARVSTRLGSMSTWDKLASLPVEIERYDFEALELVFGEQFTRHTTLIRLYGGGEEGVGEDVVYDGEDHFAMREAGPNLPIAGSWTIGSLSDHLAELDLFPTRAPERDDFRLYRRWAFESAALDLGLRQAGRSLPEQLDRELSPLNYVVSMRLGGLGGDTPETSERLVDVLGRYPRTRFKLDPTNNWTDELIAELVATGAVDSLDLKGQYKGTPVDVDTDPELYRKVAEAFPDAWLEDPDINDDTRPVLEPYRDRITWDAPIHSVDDILALEWKPRTVNIKPSRVGSLVELCRAYDFCEAEGIGAYGGGQTELGVGRDHIQYLAAVFHPDTPNDVAPSGFNQPRVPDGLPQSPLELRPAPTGFRFDGS